MGQGGQVEALSKTGLLVLVGLMCVVSFYAGFFYKWATETDEE
jgi:hypothetical protein